MAIRAQSSTPWLMQRLKAINLESLNNHRMSEIIFFIALLVYAVMAGEFLTRQSVAPHYVYLANAFLQGSLHLTEPLPGFSNLDLIFYEEHWYVAHQPLPAFFLMPLVALSSSGLSDILFTVGVGAVSVALCNLTLRVAVPDLSTAKRGWLTVFFALGTVHGYMTILGTVWFTGQVVAAVFVWLLLLGLYWRWPLLVGVAFGAIALSRPSIVPGALVVLGIWWLHERRQYPNLMWIIPFALALLILAGYNLARFGSPTDFGYDRINDSSQIAERREEFGLFNIAFLPENLYTATIRPPEMVEGRFEPDPWGMGLLLTSPALVLIAGIRVWDRETLALLIGAMVILLPSLLYHNTGSLQFGYRFILDALPLLMILLALGAQRVSVWIIASLTVYSVVVHLWGIDWLYGVLLGADFPAF